MQVNKPLTNSQLSEKMNTSLLLSSVELKSHLQEFQNGTRSWEEKYAPFIMNSMVANIGSTDSELRDHLIYQTFYKLIIENHLNQIQLVQLMTTCLSKELLFKGIEQHNTDAIFTRSFTTLVIALILHKDNADEFLTKNLIVNLKEKLIHYTTLEKDLRGLVGEKGWAHSIAHVSDAFHELVKNRFMTKEDKADIFHVLWAKVFVWESSYVDDEDERLLNPIVELLKSGSNLQLAEESLTIIPHQLKFNKSILAEEDYWTLFGNVKRFLKSFYFVLDNESELVDIKRRVKSVILSL